MPICIYRVAFRSESVCFTGGAPLYDENYRAINCNSQTLSEFSEIYRDSALKMAHKLRRFSDARAREAYTARALRAFPQTTK